MRMHRLAVVGRALLVGFGLLAAQFSFATQADLDSEVDGILADLQNKTVPINAIARRIKWSGIADRRLFDAVETELLANYQIARGVDAVDRVSWLVQFLAFSGDDKYKPTMESVAASARDAKLKRHAESSRMAFEDFKRWNPIIAKGIDSAPPIRIQKQRVINMLQGNDWSLAKSGASHVLDLYLRDPEMISLVEQRLTFIYPRIGDDDEAAEAAAWMIKLLGETNDPSHIPLLQAIAKNAERPTVRKWVDYSLRKLKSAKPRPGGPIG